MDSPAFLGDQRQNIATEGVMANRQQIAESECRAVAEQHSSLHDLTPLGGTPKPAAELPASSVQGEHLLSAPRDGNSLPPLDSANRATYTPVHQAGGDGVVEDGVEDGPMSTHRGGLVSEQFLAQELVDDGGRQITNIDWQSAYDPSDQIAIAGTGAYLSEVKGGVVSEIHGAPPVRGYSTHKSPVKKVDLPLVFRQFGRAIHYRLLIPLMATILVLANFTATLAFFLIGGGLLVLGHLVFLATSRRGE